MVLLELLAALAAAAFIVLAGSRALWVFLAHMERQNRSGMEQIEVSQLESGLRRAWQERCSHPFQEGPWLKIEGLEAGDGISLERFSMRCFADTGTVRECFLERRNGAWVYGRRDADAVRERRLRYIGTILIRLAAREWIGGAEPAEVQWRFPNASTREGQSGFVLRNLQGADEASRR